MNAAFFDFDHTITKRDTFISYIFFTCGSLRSVIGLCLLSPVLIAYKLKIIPNWKAKQIVLSFFFRNKTESWMREKGKEFAESVIPGLIRQEAQQALDFHRSNNNKIYIITASCDVWVSDWCEGNGFTLISTELEFRGGVFTGRLKTANCYGIEKVNRIKQEVNLEDYEDIYSYGNSVSDLPMLELADHKFYNCF